MAGLDPAIHASWRGPSAWMPGTRPGMTILKGTKAMAARVVFTAGFSQRYTGGVREFQVEAKNLRGIIREMDRLYPGLGEHLVEETTVAIDGAIHETAYFQPIREGCEIFFIPKLEGG